MEDGRREEYWRLVRGKIYENMTDDELRFCIEIETDIVEPKVSELRNSGVPDSKISAFLMDLYEDYIVYDDVAISDALKISDEDWGKGQDWYWREMNETNPLRACFDREVEQ